MKLEIYCPLWGSEALSFAEFAAQVSKAGYDGVEMSFPMDKKERDEKAGILKEEGLKLIAQHWETFEPDFSAHKAAFEERLRNLAETEPEFISSQTGRDWFSFDQSMEILSLADRISEEYGVKITHETHRSKMLFAAHVCKEFLRKKEDLRLTLDISHWCAVAETMLDDQEDAVALALSRADHIHARVGYREGPQVPDPFVPAWKDSLERHMAWWTGVYDNACDQGRDRLTITCEFGPWPYMVHHPETDAAIADQWGINVNMKDLLRSRFAPL